MSLARNSRSPLTTPTSRRERREVLESRSPSRAQQRTRCRRPTHPEPRRAHRRQPDLDLLLCDWTLSDQDIKELFATCKWPGKRREMIQFVQWVIKHMVVSGEQ
jgi:hypothetical protein